eukprot:INCI17345.1.p1 GENE.INCI17345.1~~INCI17345.1.p1  ORF type:complete len:342 (-),score=60.98 INCI17345.1:180-1088(-)
MASSPSPLLASAGASATLVFLPLLLLLSLVSSAAAAADDSAAPADTGGSEKTFLLLFTERCWDTFFHDLNFLDLQCIKSVVSKGLGLGIILGSFLLKAPQIFNILKARSGRGLEPTALYLDVAAFIGPAVYNFRLGYPFLSYGESIVILVQNVIIVLLVWAFSPKPVAFSHKAMVIAALCGAVVGGFAIPPEYLRVLPTLAITMTISSRLPQIAANFRTKDTGVSSSITWFLNFVGAAIRVLTTLNETGDLLQASSFALGATCSAIILMQVCIYGSKAPVEASKDAKAPAASVKDAKSKKDE